MAAKCTPEQFNQFKSKFNRVYASDAEHTARFANFCKNMQKAAKLNQNSANAKFGATKFADMSDEEFKSRVSPIKWDSQILARSCLANGVTVSESVAAAVPNPNSIPQSFDWNTKGKVSSVKDQGQCGSCWAFSTIGQLESVTAIKANAVPADYSEQLLVDCSHGCANESHYGAVCNQGCNGGWPWSAMQDIMGWGGVVPLASYPYTGVTGKCKVNFNTKPTLVAPISNYTCLSSPGTADEAAMAAYLVQHGPLSIAMDASPLQLYDGGIIDPWIPSLDCGQKQLDHAILITGYGSETGITGTTNFWIVKNSWGADWGLKGYFKIRRGTNLCGLAAAVTAIIV
jgi:cathepsin F